MQTKKFLFFALVSFLLSACASTGAKSLSPVSGESAHDFTLSDQNGKLWKLSDVLNDYNAVVLAFYPKDDTGV